MQIALFSALVAGSIDKAAGIIKGVSVITKGPAIGHDTTIDSTTLEQVKQRASEFDGGLKVKIDHWSGFDGIVGTLQNFALDDNQLRADLHLLETHPAKDRILEMAEKMPESFGLSIAFSGEAEDVQTEAADGTKAAVKCARCTELYSCDLVDQPAANPTGLFNVPSEIQTLAAEFKKTVTALQVANAEIETLRAELTTVTTLNSEQLKKLVEFEAEREETKKNILEMKDQAIALKAALGIKPAEVVPPVKPIPDKTVLEMFEDITDPEQATRFYNANVKEIKRLQSLKPRK